MEEKNKVKRWKMKSGYKPVPLKDGRTVLADQIFKSTRENIGNGFIHAFILLEDTKRHKEEKTTKPVERRSRRNKAVTPKPNVTGAEEKIPPKIEEEDGKEEDKKSVAEEKKESSVKPKGKYTMKHRAAGYYDIISPDGQTKINEKALRRTVATRQLEQLNS